MSNFLENIRLNILSKRKIYCIFTFLFLPNKVIGIRIADFLPLIDLIWINNLSFMDKKFLLKENPISISFDISKLYAFEPNQLDIVLLDCINKE